MRVVVVALCVVVLGASVIVGLLIRRNGYLREANTALSYPIEAYCHGLRIDLESATREYKQYLESKSRTDISPEDKQSVDGMINYGTLGRMTWDGRSSASLALQRTFLFCAGLRTPSHHVAELRDRFADANQRFREADDAALVIQALTNMAAQVDGVLAMPLRARR